MNAITPLKTFNTEELFHLLHECADCLAFAYQEIQEKTLFLISEEAYQACNFLMYQLQKQRITHSIH